MLGFEYTYMRRSAKQRALQLRHKGYSYNLISSMTGVSKSTLHYWLADVPYKANDVVLRRIGLGRIKAIESKNKQKLATFEDARNYALKMKKNFSDKELLWLGVGLYIGEGQKNETVGIINSDPQVIKLAIYWLTKCFGIKISNLTLAIHLYPDNNIKRCLKYWADATGIPLSQFGKTQIDMRLDKTSTKRGKLPYGTAHLRVRALGNKELGVVLSRRIHALMNASFHMRA